MSEDVTDTLSRNNPLSTFLHNQSGKLSTMGEEEFKKAYEEHVGDLDSSGRDDGIEKGTMRDEYKDKLSQSSRAGAAEEAASSSSGGSQGSSMNHPEGPLTRIVLKFTTISEASIEAPSFTIGTDGASIGRDQTNEVFIPSDAKLTNKEHARISYDIYSGSFFLSDRGYNYGVGLRIAAHAPTKQQSTPTKLANSADELTQSPLQPKSRWELKRGSHFSIGNTIMLSRGPNTDDGVLELEAVEGVCKGNVFRVDLRGAMLGRSSDNDIAIPDRELSRRHSRIDFDATGGGYYLSDCGSTNGTYMLLTGPYGGQYRLSLNDHIIVGRTGFSINRFDYGISEEIGFRQTMEDSCVIVQHLNVTPLCSVAGLTPQSFFGVFDGHGGAEAARYLSQKLHVNVAAALTRKASAIAAAAAGAVGPDGTAPKLDDLVSQILTETFVRTDDDFLETSEHKAHGSTATTTLVLGDRLYCANVGDSRVLLCRGKTGIPLTVDHKPSRPDEQARIKSAGGFVINGRVMGELAVSRAFGDADFKQGISSALQEEGMELPADTDADFEKPLIVAEPEVQSIVLVPEDRYLLLGCDGLFDVFQNDDLCAFICAEMDQHGDVQKCASALTNEAIRQRNSRDNVSVIIVVLNA